MPTPCKICHSPTASFGQQTILGKYPADYRHCPRCGYLFVDQPHWLAEAYGTAIAALDTGIVARNLWLADAACALLGLSFRSVRTSVDFGGGTGLFVRLMRDRGHEFLWHDAYSPNLLARGFEGELTQRFDLVTAFELVEHLPDPLDGFDALARLAPRLLISTDLLPEPIPPLGQWPYYAPEAGQHIGFFTERSLQVVAERLRLQLSSNGRNLHVLAEQRVSPLLLKQLRRPKRARWFARFGRRPGLTYRDADLMLARLQGQHDDRRGVPAGER